MYLESEGNTDLMFSYCWWSKGRDGEMCFSVTLSLSEEVYLALPLSAAAAFNNMFNFQQHQHVYPQTPAPLKQSHYERDFS